MAGSAKAAAARRTNLRRGSFVFIMCLPDVSNFGRVGKGAWYNGRLCNGPLWRRAHATVANTHVGARGHGALTNRWGIYWVHGLRALAHPKLNAPKTASYTAFRTAHPL